MNKKLLESIIGIGLLLIIITFNPFIFSGIYLDSTKSFTFLSLHKIILLGLLNFILLSFWIYKILKTKEFRVTPSKLYLPIILFVITTVISTLLSTNRINSLFGFNSTLSNSLVEIGMLFIFFLFIANNIREKSSVLNIIRFVNIGIAISLVWFVIRHATVGSFTGNEASQSFSMSPYLNSLYFSLNGSYASLATLALTGFILNLAVIFSTTLNNITKKLFVFDSAISILLGSGFVYALGMYSGLKLYTFIFLGLISVGFILYLLFSHKNLKSTFVNFSAITLASIVLGIACNFALIQKDIKTLRYPPVSVNTNHTLDATTKSLNSVQKSIVGNGAGNFTYAFDQNKNPDLLPFNLTTNENYPVSPELRISHPNSYFIDVLFSHGALGLLLFVSIIILALKLSHKKYSDSFDFTGVIFFVALAVISFSFLLSSYDFVLILLFWLLLSFSIVLTSLDEEQKNLDFSLSGITQSSKVSPNYSFIIPLTFLGITGAVLFLGYKLLTANYYMYESRRAQRYGTKEEVITLAEKANITYTKSDVFGRELANSRGIFLIEDRLKPLQQSLFDDKTQTLKDDRKFKEDVANAAAYKDLIINDLNYHLSLFPDDYKNYYTMGIVLSEISSYSNLAFDDAAARYFLEVHNGANPNHPESLYYLALLNERNGEYNVAMGYIQTALKLNGNNIAYNVKYADILIGLKNYDAGIQYYQLFEDSVAKNPNDQGLIDAYNLFNIKGKLAEARKLKENSAEDTKQPVENEQNPDSLLNENPDVTPIEGGEEIEEGIVTTTPRPSSTTRPTVEAE